METPMSRALLTSLAAVAVLGGSACGGGGSTSSEPPVQTGNPSIFGSCTGPVPANATLCPGADAGLTADAARVLKAGCTCDANCRQTPCSYACDAGFILLDGVCRPRSPASAVAVVDNGDGTVTVTDSYGARVWLRDANCMDTVAGVTRAGPIPWTDAAAWIWGLGSGACGLTDGSSPGAWRLPNEVELSILSADLAAAGDAARSAFTGIQSRGYWTSFSTCIGIYGVVEMGNGAYADVSATVPYNVWPVR